MVSARIQGHKLKNKKISSTIKKTPKQLCEPISLDIQSILVSQSTEDSTSTIYMAHIFTWHTEKLYTWWLQFDLICNFFLLNQDHGLTYGLYANDSREQKIPGLSCWSQRRRGGAAGLEQWDHPVGPSLD